MCELSPPPAAAGRRAVIGAGLGAGLAGASAVLVPPTASYAADGATAAGLVYRGRFTGVGDPDWHYLPVEVPRGTTRIDVAYGYDKLETGAGVSFNIIDIGIFDASGKGLGDAAGFRGWSGGARDRFSISRSRATPGYLAGPIGAGTWHVVLGPFTVVPPGVEWTVTVTLHRGGARGQRFRPRPAPRRVRGTGPGWYRGDLHTHTVHSDGRHTQASLLALAREAGLDFLASTEHNTTSAHLTWGRHVPDDFLVVPGEEVTTRAGHCVTLGQPAGAWIDWRYRPEDDQLGRFTERVRRLGGMSVAAHPFAPTAGSTWQYGYDDVDAVELWNGPWTLDDQTALSAWHALLVAGRFVPAVGSSDSHHDGQQVGRAQTVVHAEQLSVGAVVRGLRRGRSWLAESSAVELGLEARLGGARGRLRPEPGRRAGRRGRRAPRGRRGARLPGAGVGPARSAGGRGDRRRGTRRGDGAGARRGSAVRARRGPPPRRGAGREPGRGGPGAARGGPDQPRVPGSRTLPRAEPQRRCDHLRAA